MKKIVICLIGPTAVGKTEVSLKLAKKIDAEIICCDSMQVYRGLNIATSKPTKRQRKCIAHHFVDVLNPSQEYNAARFRRACQRIIKDIHQRKKVPLIVAGTGLYLRALLDGLFSGPGEDCALRKKLYQQAKYHGSSYCYRRLKRIDPQAAGSIHAHDLRRIIRALEVYMLTGKTITELKRKTKGIRSKYMLYLFGLKRERVELYQRIDQRVEAMFHKGLVAEIKKLSKGKVSKTAKSLLGYKEVSGLLKGNYSRDEAKRLLQLNTRRYAKRQLTWFRKEKGIHWIEVGAQDTPEVIAERILSFLV